MAYLGFDNIKIVGVSAVVPSKKIDNYSWLKEKNAYPSSENLLMQTSIKERRVSYKHTGLDMSYYAADQLIKDLHWNRDDVDALISITSFPDYVMPNNACILQNRLELDNHCYAHDIAVESSGWIYGLSAVASLMQSGNIKKAIIVSGVGRVKLEDNSQDFMFGHAGSATAIEYDPIETSTICFYFGADASRAEDIWVNQYGMRRGRDRSRLKYRDYEGDEIYNVESSIDVFEQFRFSIENNILSIKTMFKHLGKTSDDIDYLLLQQDSSDVIRCVTECLGFDSEKVPSNIEKYGNTGASSIPLTMVSELSDVIRKDKTRFLCSASGGLSVSAVSFDTKNIVVSDLIEIEE